MADFAYGQSLLPKKTLGLRVGDVVEFTAGRQGGNELLELTINGQPFAFPGIFILTAGIRYRVEAHQKFLRVAELVGEEIEVLDEDEEDTPPEEDKV